MPSYFDSFEILKNDANKDHSKIDFILRGPQHVRMIYHSNRNNPESSFLKKFRSQLPLVARYSCMNSSGFRKMPSYFHSFEILTGVTVKSGRQPPLLDSSLQGGTFEDQRRRHKKGPRIQIAPGAIYQILRYYVLALFQSAVPLSGLTRNFLQRSNPFHSRPKRVSQEGLKEHCKLL